MTMIDEEWLAQALSDLGATIEVPSDGPARVLAARGTGTGRSGRGGAGRRPEGSGPSRHRALIAVAVALASVGVLGIGLVVARRSTTASTSAARSTIGQLPTSNGPPIASGVTMGPLKAAAVGGSDQAPAATAIVNAGAGVISPATPPGTAPTVATKVIKTGTVGLQVGRGKLSPAVDQLTSLAGGLGGYVADTTTNELGSTPTADMTLRVPADQFETLLARAQGLGKPTSVTTSGQDVTSAYVDLTAQIQALEDTRTQYLQIMAKATTIGDILSVEQQLSDLQTQLDQLQGQQMVLADQTSFGTLTIHLSESGSSLAPPPAHGLAKAWDHARSSFADGVEAVIGASGGILVFLVFAGLVLLAGRLAWPVIRRRLV
jgi:Domain of unknown function (DUF4349)